MIRSGFYNSRNHDRLYYNSDMSRLFNSLIKDGVFQNIGNKFIVGPGSGMEVIIPSGMAYFNSTWIFNDTDYAQAIDTAPIVAGYTRIDGVFLKMGPVDDLVTRENSIYYMPGNPASQGATRPVPVSENGEVYVPICYITVAADTTAITAAMITNTVGTTDCPFVSGILETIEATELLRQWEAQWNDWLSIKNTAYSDFMDSKSASFTDLVNTEETLFTNWFDSVKDDLGEISIGNLKNRVDEITNIYVQDKTLYLPNTAASVTEDGKLVLGTNLQSHIEGGAIEKINVGGVDYDINTFNDIYYQNETLYLPNTGASVTETGVLVIGSGTGSEPGGEVKKINVGGYEYDIVPDASKIAYGNSNIKDTLDVFGTTAGLGNTPRYDSDNATGNGAYNVIGTFTLPKKGMYLVAWCPRTRAKVASTTVGPDDTLSIRSVTGIASAVPLAQIGIGYANISQTTSGGVLYFITTNEDNAKFSIGLVHWNGSFYIEQDVVRYVRLR